MPGQQLLAVVFGRQCAYQLVPHVGASAARCPPLPPLALRHRSLLSLLWRAVAT